MGTWSSAEPLLCGSIRCSGSFLTKAFYDTLTGHNSGLACEKRYVFGGLDGIGR